MVFSYNEIKESRGENDIWSGKMNIVVGCHLQT